MKKLTKPYWYAFIISFLFVNENLVQWALAILVGNYSFVSGFNDAFKYTTFTGYLFFSVFRAIPYITLYYIIKSKLKKSDKNIKGKAWGGLIEVLFVIIWLSWGTMHSLYTEEHTSSTAAVAFIFIPLYAILGSLIGMFIGGSINDAVVKKEKT